MSLCNLSPVKHVEIQCELREKANVNVCLGHSFEFERNNNWNLIGNFCNLASKSSNTWFATNIEVMRYVKELKALEFSAKGDTVYNPTAITVWISADGKAVKVKAGETIRF